MKLHTRALVVVTLLVVLTGCAIFMKSQKPLQTVQSVDLPRFMGGWYVIGTIPWFVEKNNVGTMDIYKMRPDGKIDITYVFHKKSLAAPRSEMKAVATVVDQKSHASWAVQFLWPFKAPYLITDLADDYRYTVIAHPSRNLVWIMSRKPFMEETDYIMLLSHLKNQGYDVSRIQKVPQRVEMPK